MARVWIDGTAHEVDASKNMLEVCVSLGYDLPFFCWHEALGSVGACRQCAVKQFKDERDSRGRVVMACMTPAAEGTRISVDDPEARAFRKSVIEWLMVNHPHDCPVCDEGGECHLQDMTVMTGHATREYRFSKRTHRNQYLGPFINHEMNRCIACYRCVRFYQDYAGGRDLDVFGAHDDGYFGRDRDGVLESEFSGNLVEVCPTGVFTDKTLMRHYTRKWDLATAPSVCVHCSLGCNTIPGERYGELRRIRTRYHSKVNGHFLCDRGRYGYEFANHERRITEPLVPAGPHRPAARTTGELAVGRVAAFLAEQGRVVGIGSPRASLESNLALKQLVGPDRFHLGVSEAEGHLLAAVVEILRDGPARTPSLAEVGACDAVLVLGEDVSNTAPMAALALRQSVRRQPLAAAAALKLPSWHDRAVRELLQKDKGPLYLLTPASTRLDGEARRVLRAPPADIARVGLAVAHALDASSPAVDGLGEDMRALAEEIAGALAQAARPLVVSGCGGGNEAVLRAAAAVTAAAGKKRDGRAAEIFLVVPECNSLGLALLGGASLGEALDAGDVRTAVILENDLYRRAAPARVERFLSRVEHVVVLDHLAHGTSAGAGILLPAATWAESDGTLVNNEGRAQRFFSVMPPRGKARPSWGWLCEVAHRAGRDGVQHWRRIDDAVRAVAAQPGFAAVAQAAVSSDLRFAGARLPRQPHRYSGRTAMGAHESVHEPKPPEDASSPFAYSMEGYTGPEPGLLAPRFWAPGWNSVQALHRFEEEVHGPLAGGEPGARLIEPAAEARARTAELPEAFARRAGELWLVPLWHIHGSEELSALSPAVAELSPAPYLALCPADATAIGAAEGEELEIEAAGLRLRLAVRIFPELTSGVAGLPAGLASLPHVELPAWGRAINR